MSGKYAEAKQETELMAKENEVKLPKGHLEASSSVVLKEEEGTMKSRLLRMIEPSLQQASHSIASYIALCPSHDIPDGGPPTASGFSLMMTRDAAGSILAAIF